MTEKRLLKLLTKWLNSIPWKPKDFTIECKPGVTSYTPTDKSFKNCPELELLSEYRQGAYCFMKWMEHEKKN